jgi:poly(3-hydroxybutyrate) depolymerase
MILVAVLPLFLLAGDLPRGTVIDSVSCTADASQSYALYLPSGYSSNRAWPVIFGFDPAGHGRNAVDRYHAAAEKYGYIVAGSNNSRNGSLETQRIVAAMIGDITGRFAVDQKRMYTAGMSGGSRVAFAVALSADIAGVFASSAGYPDGKPRKALAFPVFMTAGTEDFNHLEMRGLDRDLTSPHRLAIFEGGHTWLSTELALEAVEWMELQAMKSGLKPRDAAEIDAIFSKRVAAVHYADKDEYLAADAMAADFAGLHDVSAFASRAAALAKDRGVRAALKRDRDEDAREISELTDERAMEAKLASDTLRQTALMQLNSFWKRLSDDAKKPDDTPDRRLARRVLSELSMEVAEGNGGDPEYLKIVQEYRMGRGGRPR